MNIEIKNKRTLYLIVAGIVLIIAIAVSVGYLFYYLNQKVANEKLTPEKEIELQKEIAGIVKMNDFNKCQEVRNQLYKTVCINNIALNLAKEKQDISYCQRLDDKLSIADCERQIISTKSQDKEDINVCNETKNSEIQKECKNTFWPTLALKKENVALCNNTTTEQEKNLCYDNYLFKKEFINTRDNFDCQKFYDLQVKSDCQIYLKGKPINCSVLKSNLFLNYCLSTSI